MAAGSNSKVMGSAFCIHSIKLMPVCAAAMALGGLPTKVAMPPMLAQ